MTDEVRIDYSGGIAFEAHCREHSLTIDLPQEKGGLDSGMTPPEAFMASLGACVGVYVVRYCQNAKLDASGMQMRLTWKLSEDKSRISDINIKLSLPHADIGKRAAAILSVAHRCLLHNTISGNPEIKIDLT